MGCGNKPKHTCGDRRSNARCVFYDIPVPTYSRLKEEDCITVEETTDDLYNLISWLKESVDISEVSIKDLDVESVPDSYVKGNHRVLLKEVITKLISELNNLKNRVDEKDPEKMDLDYKCLVSPCGNQISTTEELLQVLIDEVCNLKSINNLN